MWRREKKRRRKSKEEQPYGMPICCIAIRKQILANFVLLYFPFLFTDWSVKDNQWRKWCYQLCQSSFPEWSSETISVTTGFHIKASLLVQLNTHMQLVICSTDYVENRQGACSFHTAKDKSKPMKHIVYIHIQRVTFIKQSRSSISFSYVGQMFIWLVAKHCQQFANFLHIYPISTDNTLGFCF